MGKIIVFDFGSQYTQLIARRIREAGVYSEVVPPWHPVQEFREVKGIILSGSPKSVYEDDAPLPDRKIFELGIPILGICYGLQVIAYFFNGTITRAEKKEYGFKELFISEDRTDLFEGITSGTQVWMSHGDRIEKLPPGFKIIAYTDNSPYAAIYHPSKNIFGVQFHPEVVHTKDGRKILENFIFRICKAPKNWEIKDFTELKIREIQERVGKDKVLLALSGGVDSSVVAKLLEKAIGFNYYPVFIDTGLLKLGEKARVKKYFGNNPNLIIIDAEKEFLETLKGIENPEEKRRIIGHKFIELFEKEAVKLKDEVKYLAQGTLYPDVIESRSVIGPSEVIKSHHNVGGLPEYLPFELLEPLKELFKDEVREMGKILGLPPEITERHPFPGPGMAVRIIGEVTKEKVKLIQKADSIIEEVIKKHGLYNKTWQVFPVLLPVKSVGVKGDRRSYEYTVVIRAVESIDGMTADWFRMPYNVLNEISTKIINELENVNRVVYDITSKPPATIEWE